MHLSTLTSQIELDHHQTTAAVIALTHDLEQAVPSFLGLQLVVLDHGCSVTLTAFDPSVHVDQIATSLRFTMHVLGVDGASSVSAITCYAGTPGGFVDLAADLSHAETSSRSTAGPGSSGAGTSPSAISVDDRRRPTTMTSGMVGLDDLSTVNRAIGILIGSGHHPDDASTGLSRLAAAADVPLLAYATQLIRPGQPS